MSALKQSLWTERYRPPTLNELLLPARVKVLLDGPLKNYLFHGTQGTGKTSAAYILARKNGVKDPLLLNGSLDVNIDVVRNAIEQYCSLRSMDHAGVKLVIFDDINKIPEKSQEALRVTIEKYTDTARFIFTSNYPHQLISPLRSRLSEVSFDFGKEETLEQTKLYMARIVDICTANNMTISSNALTSLITSTYPDMRKIIDKLQMMHDSGVSTITLNDISISITKGDYSKLFDTLLSTTDPRKLFQQASLFKSKELDVIAACGTELIDYVSVQKPELADKLGKVAVLAHKYAVESKMCIDVFVTLLALCYELALALKQ